MTRDEDIEKKMEALLIALLRLKDAIPPGLEDKLHVIETAIALSGWKDVMNCTEGNDVRTRAVSRAFAVPVHCPPYGQRLVLSDSGLTEASRLEQGGRSGFRK